MCSELNVIDSVGQHQINAGTANIQSNISPATTATRGKSCNNDKHEVSNAQPRHLIGSVAYSSFFSQSAPRLCALAVAPSQRSGAARRHSVHTSSAPAECHTVFPRRKAGDGIYFSSPQPIVITLDTLHTLKEQPLGSAAEMLGMSPTALKRACRALGIHRWAYQRGSDRFSARALRRRTNAARRAAAASQRDGRLDEAIVQDEPGETDLSWIVPPMLAQGQAGAGVEQEIELCSEEEALTGPAVFEWPRYI